MRNSFLMLGMVILLAGCQSSGARVKGNIAQGERVPGGGDGSFPYAFPPAPEGQKFIDVMGEAEAVIKENYPLWATVVKSRHVLARSKVFMHDAIGQRAQKVATVWVRKTNTGHWHPEVTVRLMVNEPSLRAGRTDPSSASVPFSRPIAGSPVWHPLERLIVEEQKLYDAIYDRLNG